jgi:biotin carboxylase
MFDQKDQTILVERYIDGTEFAVEGVVSGGNPEILAIFDKPRPLVGPYFEETIYLLPSAAQADLQHQIEELVVRSVVALGIDVGAFHAEVRAEGLVASEKSGLASTDTKVFLIELAARSIGGKCSKSLRFKNGRTLEEVLLARQLGIDLEGRTKAQQQVSGVLMIPTPKEGILRSVSGQEAVAGITNVTEVDISTPIGSYLRPVPFSDGYLGFVFAKGPSRSKVLDALNQAEALLGFEIDQESLTDEC